MVTIFPTRLTPIILSGLFLFPLVAHAEDISLDQLLATVEATHPLFAKERAGVASVEAARDEADAGEGWYLAAEGYVNRDESPRSQPFYPDRVERQGVVASARRPVWATGGEVTLSHAYVHTDQQVAGATIPLGPGQPPFALDGGSARWYQGGTTLTYLQPLWQDRGGSVSRLSADLARYDADAARIGAAERKEAFLAEVAERYINWVFLRESRQVAQSRVALATKDRNRVRQMRASNLVDEVDRIRSDDAVLGASLQVASLTASERGAAEELARLVGIERLAERSPAMNLYALPPAPSPDAVGGEVQSVRLVAEIDTRIAQAGRGLEGATSMVDPRLDLIVSGTSEGAGEGATDGYGADATDYTAALRFTYQLGAGSSKAARLRAWYDRERWVSMKEETLRSLDAAARGMAVRLRELETVRAIDRRRIDAAEARADAEHARYRQGRSDYTYVIAARDMVQQARLQYAADAALSQSLVFRLRALTDRLYGKGE